MTATYFFVRKKMAKTPSKKSAKAPKKAAGKTTKKKRTESYSSYIYKVLKQVHPDTGISSKGMVVMCNFISDLFERIGNEAANVCRFSKKQTLSSREVQTAVRLVEFFSRPPSAGRRLRFRPTCMKTGLEVI